jgi:hypothetical protein
MGHALNIRILSGSYAVSRLGPDAKCPAWIDGKGVSALVRADDELTIVCRDDRVPDGVETEKGWSCLRTIGPFPFDAAGIVHSLIAPLSENGIGIFVLCTFDGEHLLVQSRDLAQVKRHLIEAGHHLEPS